MLTERRSCETSSGTVDQKLGCNAACDRNTLTVKWTPAERKFVLSGMNARGRHAEFVGEFKQSFGYTFASERHGEL